VPRYDATNAELFVFTFKEGLLSAIAHDLKIHVTRFSVEVNDARSSLELKADARSLKVQHALQAGAPNPGALSDSDKQKIEKNITDDVLQSDKHPEIRFVSTAIAPAGDGFSITGNLTLHGITRSISVSTRAEGGRQVAEIPIHQPDYGIKPYSAMLGTLKIKPDLKVRLSVPL
jgi:polyisoprenoid-binding protein YceI